MLAWLLLVPLLKPTGGAHLVWWLRLCLDCAHLAVEKGSPPEDTVSTAPT